MIAALLSVISLILLAEPSRALLRSEADEQVAKANVRSRRSDGFPRQASQVKAMASALALTPAASICIPRAKRTPWVHSCRFVTMRTCGHVEPAVPRRQSRLHRHRHIRYAENVMRRCSGARGVAYVGDAAAFHRHPSLHLQHCDSQPHARDIVSRPQQRSHRATGTAIGIPSTSSCGTRAVALPLVCSPRHAEAGTLCACQTGAGHACMQLECKECACDHRVCGKAPNFYNWCYVTLLA